MFFEISSFSSVAADEEGEAAAKVGGVGRDYYLDDDDDDDDYYGDEEDHCDDCNGRPESGLVLVRELIYRLGAGLAPGGGGAARGGRKPRAANRGGGGGAPPAGATSSTTWLARGATLSTTRPARSADRSSLEDLARGGGGGGGGGLGRGGPGIMRFGRMRGRRSCGGGGGGSGPRRPPRREASLPQPPRRPERRPERRGERPREVWRSAIDPASGRPYYFEVTTRRTQWEKPAGLAASEESEAAARKRREDAEFFREMERNIRRSLARGRVAPGQRPPSLETSDAEGEGAKGAVDLRSPTSVAASEVQPPQQSAAAMTKGGSDPQGGGNDDGARVEESGASPRSGRPVPDLAEEEGGRPGGRRGLHVRRNTSGTIYAGSHLFHPDVEATIRCVCKLYRDHILEAAALDGRLSSPASVRRGAEDVEYGVFDDDYGEGGGIPSLPSRALLRRIAEVSSGLFDSFQSPSPSAAAGGGRGGTDARGDEPRVPSLDLVVAFLAEVHRRAKMEADAVIISLLYVRRLVDSTGGAVRPNARNWRSVLFSCMALASKVWDDLSMWNGDFSEVCRRGGPRPLPTTGGGDAHRRGDADANDGDARWRLLRLSSFTLPRVNLLERTLLRCLGYDASVSAAAYAELYFLARSMALREGRGDGEAAASDVRAIFSQDGDGPPETPPIGAPLLDTEGARRLGVLGGAGGRGNDRGGRVVLPPPGRRAAAAKGKGKGAPRSHGRAWTLHDLGAVVVAAVGEAERDGGGGGRGPSAARRSVCLEQVVSM